MKWLVILLIIGLPVHGFSQNAIDSLSAPQFVSPYDSVYLSVWNICFKDNSSPLPNGEEPQPHPNEELVTIKLSQKESKKLLKQLKKKNSYDHERSLQNHYDLVLTFYHSGRPAQRIEISMMTGNIIAENLYNDAYFRNGCSKNLGKHIEHLLIEHGVIEQIGYDEVDLMGLRQ